MKIAKGEKMSIDDKIKWDNKYQNKPELLKPREASNLIKKYTNMVEDKTALDLACGTGRNSIYLAENGFIVDAVDISETALNCIENENINKILYDLDEFETNKKYGLIIKMNFLDRDLIEKAKEWLDYNGVFIIETYLDHKDNEKKHSNKDFLLQPNELKEFFKDGYEILEYSEYDNENYEMYRMKKAGIAVRKMM